MEQPVETVFDFMAECAPLPHQIGSIYHWWVWCPHMAHAIYHLEPTIEGMVSITLSDKQRQCCFMPHDRNGNTPLRGYGVAGTTGQQRKQDEEFTHGIPACVTSYGNPNHLCESPCPQV